MTNFQKNSWITGFAFSLSSTIKTLEIVLILILKSKKKKRKANTSCPCRADANIVRGISQFINAAFGVSWAPFGSPVSRIFPCTSGPQNQLPTNFSLIKSSSAFIWMCPDSTHFLCWCFLIWKVIPKWFLGWFLSDLPISTNVVGMICQHILFVL